MTARKNEPDAADALMHAKGKREMIDPQSAGNLALANESLGVLQKPKAKPRSPRLIVVPDITREVEADALAPTTEILNGIRLSLTLWSLIGVIILLIGKILTY